MADQAQQVFEAFGVLPPAESVAVGPPMKGKRGFVTPPHGPLPQRVAVLATPRELGRPTEENLRT